MVTQFNANHGRLPIMCQNPSNAVICLGHSKGVVSMWTPNTREPVVRMWAHKQPLTSIAVDRSGTYMATSAMDRSLKIWDARMFKCSLDYKLPAVPSQIQFSDRRVLAVSMDNEVQVRFYLVTVDYCAIPQHLIHFSYSKTLVLRLWTIRT